MSFTNRPHRSESTAALRRRFWGAGGILWVAAVALVTTGLPGAARAQNFFPTTPPSQVFAEDFEGGIDWTIWQQMPPASGNWTIDTRHRCSTWGTGTLKERGVINNLTTSLVVIQSMPGNAGYDPDDWTNLRMDFELKGQPSQEGFWWGLQPDNNSDGYPDAGYLFYIDDFAVRGDPPGPANRATWHLIRRENDVNTEIGTAQVVLREGVARHDSMYLWTCYHMRIEWFCGNLRVQVRDWAESTWHTIVEWVEQGTVLTPGGVGFFHNVPGSRKRKGYWDNLEVSSWGPDCRVFCDPWTAWGVDWAPSHDHSEAIDKIPFKLLFSSVLADGTLVALDGSYKGGNALCDVWEPLAPFPDPTEPTGSNSDLVKAYLERVSTSVSAADMFSFSPNFNNTDNPIPLMYWGQTPINKTLQSAYEWYKALRGPGGQWSDEADPLAHCRNWYIIFITDGEESCDMVNPGDTPEVCQWLASSESFAHPGAGLGEKVPILTIGFSNVGDDSPLRCMSTLTGGEFKTAKNASQLAAAIANVTNLMTELSRSFLPVTVSPEPAALGSSFSNEFLLTLPVFVPRNNTSVWEGHYYAFQINPSNPTPPLDSDGKLDYSQAEWDASTEISTQITNNDRKIFYSRASGTGRWSVRTPFLDTSDGNLLTEFKSWTGVALDSDATEMVHFVQGTAASRSNALGDIFHSKPAVVGPPNDYRYYLNNVHNYFSTFMSPRHHRRRVAFVGSNDALFHAFDAGFYDRDDGGRWDDTFDLGTGTELFAYVPHAVVDPYVKPSSIKTMTFGDQQVYSVDGSVTSADVFIDPTGGVNPKWRTVVLFGLRRGGRGVTALDVTQPDPINASTGEPILSTLPGCLNGGSGCDGEYPKPLWEFTPDRDTDDNGDGEPDLGLTWSQPVITRVKVQGGKDAFVTFFGGGMPVRPGDPADHTATYLYALNVATGVIVGKWNIGSAVPGGLEVLDQNDDGFGDRVYFGDTNGSLWRLDITGETVDTGSGHLNTSAWTLTRIYQFSNLGVYDDSGNLTGSTPAEFFMKPKLVPVSFNGGSYTWGIAIGTGDRAHVGKMDGVRNRFYFVMDYDDTTRDETDLHGVDLGDGNEDTETTFFNPSSNEFGWYLRLRPNEKVTTDGIIVAKKVQFATFEATPPGANQGKCSAGGQGRIYQVYYNNVNPVEDTRGQETEGGLIGGGAAFTVGDTTISWWTHMDVTGTKLVANLHPIHRVTNWRQE